MLRPQQWLVEHGVSGVGSELYLELTELDIRGWGVVTGVDVKPRVADGPGRVVLMTVNHDNIDVYELRFVQGGRPLRGTGAHPLYSLERNDWVPVRELQVGERLQTAEGAVTVASLEKVRGVHRVYNLEVEGDHEYLVGDERVRAHNTCPDPEVVDFIQRFKAKYPGRSFKSGHFRTTKDGRKIEIDFETDNAIIEFKAGRGNGLTRQVKDRLEFGKTCIGVACSASGVSPHARRSVHRAGGLLGGRGDIEDILDIIAPD